jgi:hypothetical protein
MVQLNLVQAFTPCVSRIYYSIFPYMSKSSKWCLFVSYDKNLIMFNFLCTCYLFLLSHTLLLIILSISEPSRLLWWQHCTSVQKVPSLYL